jgi:hypothetical protein
MAAPTAATTTTTTTTGDKTIYYGTFVHSTPESHLETIHGAIGVDANGKIAWVERHVDNVDSSKEKHGWQSASVVALPASSSFFFPGFIGRYLAMFHHHHHHQSSRALHLLTLPQTLISMHRNTQTPASLENPPSWTGSATIRSP